MDDSVEWITRESGGLCKPAGGEPGHGRHDYCAKEEAGAHIADCLYFELKEPQCGKTSGVCANRRGRLAGYPPFPGYETAAVPACAMGTVW
jgi:hypothetical protein